MAYNTATYDKAITEYDKKMKADAAAAKKQKSAEFDSQAKSAYISKMQNQRTLNNNLASSGIRGGASESSQLKIATNYENNRNQIAQQKSSALTDIDKNANDLMFNNRQTQLAAKQSYIQAREAEARQIAETKRQEKWQAAQTDKKNKETRYAATVSGYTSNKKIDKLIKKIIKSKKDVWRVSYLRAQKATNTAKKKKKK